jgi:hypothetical protein
MSPPSRPGRLRPQGPAQSAAVRPQTRENSQAASRAVARCHRTRRLARPSGQFADACGEVFGADRVELLAELAADAIAELVAVGPQVPGLLAGEFQIGAQARRHRRCAPA